MIALLDYGSGNIRSVHKALIAAGAEADLVRRPEALSSNHSAMVLPGVGAFDDCIRALKRQSLWEAVVTHIQSGKFFLGICVGFQVLFEKSEEFGSRADGLKVFRGKVLRFPSTHLKVPHMGWNQLDILQSRCPLFKGIASGSYAYFVHSFYPQPADENIIASRTDYGVSFASAVWRGNVFATQFHPEKSQEIGMQMLRNFIEMISTQNDE